MSRLVIWIPGEQGPQFSGYLRVRAKLVEALSMAGFFVINGGLDLPGERVLQISHFQPFKMPDYERVWHRRPGAARAILYTTFESSHLPPHWAEHAAQFDAVWTTSEWTRKVFAEELLAIGAGHVPVHVVGHGIDGGQFPIMDRTSRIHTDAPFQFLWKGMHYEDRKQGLRVIDVFTRLKLPDARLMVKCAPRSAGRQVMKDFDGLGGGPGATTLVSEWWSDDDQRRALFNSDFFIQPTRCEGFGLEPLEAMATGLPAAVTAWSGPRDYLFDDLLTPEDFIGGVEARDLAAKLYSDPDGTARGKGLGLPLRYEIVEAYYNEAMRQNVKDPISPESGMYDHDFGVDAKVPDDALAEAMEFAYRHRAELHDYTRRQVAPLIHSKWTWARAATEAVEAMRADGFLEEMAWEPRLRGHWVDAVHKLNVGDAEQDLLPVGVAAPFQEEGVLEPAQEGSPWLT